MYFIIINYVCISVHTYGWITIKLINLVKKIKKKKKEGGRGGGEGFSFQPQNNKQKKRTTPEKKMWGEGEKKGN